MRSKAQNRGLALLVANKADLAALTKSASMFFGGGVMPILSGLKGEMESGLLTLTATNLTRYFKSSLPVSLVGKKLKPFVVKGDILRAALDRASDDAVEASISLERNIANVELEPTSHRLYTLPSEDFPAFPAQPEGPLCDFDRGSLIKALQLTSFAVKDTKRSSISVLSGVHIRIETGGAVFVATNGHRMALFNMAINGLQMPKPEALTLNAEDIQALLRLLQSTEDETIHFGIKKNFAFFDFDKTVFASSVVEGDFPDFEKLFDKEADIQIVFNREALKNAASGADAVANRDTHKVSLVSTDSGVSVTTEHLEYGKAEVKLDVESDKPFHISLNASYLRDVLSRLDSESVVVSIIDSDRPVSISPFDPVGSEKFFTYLIMPFREGDA